MSAYTITDMPRIVKHHGLVPVPLDLSSEDLGIDTRHLEKMITPQTCMLVVAHLFGIQLNLDKLISVAKRRNLIVIEDCAQIFTGRRFSGHADADLTMFSFGSIKTATALAGGLILIRDEELANRMKSRQNEYPTQSRFSYLKKAIKYSLLKLISYRPFFCLSIGILRILKIDYDRELNRMSRGFPGRNFFEQLRKKPHHVLLRTMLSRIRAFDEELLKRRIARGRRLSQNLPASVRSPGTLSDRHCYWVYPVLAKNPKRLIKSLREKGFDATQGGSMKVIEPPLGHSRVEPVYSHQLHRELVYLPFYPELSDSALEMLPEIVMRSERIE